SEVIAPVAVDVQVSMVVGLLAEAELLHDPAAGEVVRADVHLDAVQPAGAEGVVDDERERGGDDAPAGNARINPISGVRGAEGPPHDVAEGELPDEALGGV